ncbi:hypothetical protein, partial [Streptomyces djakartensis]|uniref:hypothetical protein n=1 Tax=Streptomyces djakartensis TaxID=68193 RepID=UPI0034DE65CB
IYYRLSDCLSINQLIEFKKNLLLVGRTKRLERSVSEYVPKKVSLCLAKAGQMHHTCSKSVFWPIMPHSAHTLSEPVGLTTAIRIQYM